MPVARITALPQRSGQPPERALAAVTPELVERMLETVADVLVRVLELEPGNVVVRYVEASGGRLYSGGSVAGSPI